MAMPWREIRLKCDVDPPLGTSIDAHNDEQRRRNVKILMVLTSHDQLGNTGRKTGFWL